MTALLMLVLAVALIAILVIIVDLVAQRLGADRTIRILVDIVVLILAIVIVWPRLGW